MEKHNRHSSADCVYCERDALKKALTALVGRSDNGDTIDPDWYEIDNARAVLKESPMSLTNAN